MKNLLVLILVLQTSLFLSENVYSQNLFQQPESVVYDSVSGFYFVSNKLNGDIIKLSKTGNQTVFKSGLVSCRGLTIVNRTLFAASSLGVIGINIENASIISTVNISGMSFLNDIESDNTGYLYTSDSDLGRIFRVKISDGSYTTFVSSGISGCNGLLFDGSNNRLLCCLWAYPGPIKSINISNGSVSDIIQTNLDGCDGLTRDGLGNVYISSFLGGTVYRYSANFSSRKLVSSNHSGSADIYYNKIDSILAVPNFNSNSVNLIYLQPSAISKNKTELKDYLLYQNYPNPFNPSTNIRFNIPGNSFVTLKVFDILGKEIATLVKEKLYAGEYEVSYTGTNLTSGVYFYKVEAGEFTDIKKMVLIK